LLREFIHFCNGDCKFRKWVGDNTNISKKILLLFISLFVLSINCLNAQTDAQEAVSDVQSEEQMLIISPPSEDFSSEQSLKTNTTWQFIKLILVLILVIVCIYGIVWFLKKTSNPNFQPDPYLKKVAALNLSPGKSVFIVSTPTQAFLVGTSDNSVNLIGEINDKDLIDSMNLAAEKVPTAKPKDFASILASFFPKGNTDETEEFEEFDDYFSSVAQKAGEKIRQKREQIQNKNKNNSGGDSQ